MIHRCRTTVFWPPPRICQFGLIALWLGLLGLFSGQAQDHSLGGGPAIAGTNLPPGGPTWQEIEASVTDVNQNRGGELEIHLAEGPHKYVIWVAAAADQVPTLYSRIQVTGFFTPVFGQDAKPVSENIHLADEKQFQLLTGQWGLLITNAAQFDQAQLAGFPREMVLHLSGTILALSPSGRHLVLQDDSGAALLELDQADARLQPGRQVRLCSNAMFDNGRLVLRDLPVVNNDGYHTLTKKTGRIYLTAGKHPLRLIWFNWLGPGSLAVDYQKPTALTAEKIPDNSLFHQLTNPISGTVSWTNGLAYWGAEGRWFQVPDFYHLVAARTGSIANFDLGVKSREENVSLQFAGALEAVEEGIYEFSTTSDD
ncbi:MAG TPA: hypothetical protein VF607_05340, partial [Verrucomicrobiae bacterium]